MSNPVVNLMFSMLTPRKDGRLVGRLTGPENNLLRVLCERADDHGVPPYGLSYTTLAFWTSTSRRTVMRSAASLRAKGYIDRASTGQDSNNWRVLIKPEVVTVSHHPSESVSPPLVTDSHHLHAQGSDSLSPKTSNVLLNVVDIQENGSFAKAHEPDGVEERDEQGGLIEIGGRRIHRRDVYWPGDERATPVGRP